MEVQKVLNPETKRWIKKGGKVYLDLLKRGILGGPIPQQKKMVAAYVPPVQQSYKVPEQFVDYPIDKSQQAWGAKKPSSVGQRKSLLENCGESCFLIPAQTKFPICNKTLPCTYNCRGIKGAASRAGQWKYTSVLAKAKELSAKYGCYKTKKT
jgi:hypothetical protein